MINLPTAPAWISVLSACLTPAIAVLTGYIAYRQWRTADLKLRLDLFDRRHEVYTAAREMLASVIRTGNVSDEELIRFTDGTHDARWLMNRKAAGYLQKELYDKLIDLQTLQKSTAGLSPQERVKNLASQAELKKWFGRQFAVLDGHFDKALRLPS
jgi:hypothetical protein